MNAIGDERTRLGRYRAASDRNMSLERLEAALLKVAHLVARDPAFAPIFERLKPSST
jgi:hypothetical protein